MIDTIISFFGDLPAWINAITGILAAATAITILTPTKSDDKVIQFILGVANTLAGNFGQNKNADDK